jgi:nucleotide-binding universal stress UspA family protein
MLTRIAHATDFSIQSGVAFLHALRLALDSHSRLDLLHVKDPSEQHSWHSFPHVREVLVRWGLLDPQATPADIEAKLGVHVSKIEINHHDALSGISTFLISHRPDLVVVATHGRQGINRWIHGSVAEDVLRRTHVPSLLIGPECQGFVEPKSGEIKLRRILVPIAPAPAPPVAWTLKMLSFLLSHVGVTGDECELIHVAGEMPDVLDTEGKTRKVEHLDGPVIDTILRVATERNVDLIAMATAGRHGFLDGFRGGHTSQVLAQAPCPVLALPLVVR